MPCVLKNVGIKPFRITTSWGDPYIMWMVVARGMVTRGVRWLGLRMVLAQLSRAAISAMNTGLVIVEIRMPSRANVSPTL